MHRSGDGIEINVESKPVIAVKNVQEPSKKKKSVVSNIDLFVAHHDILYLHARVSE